MKTAPRSSGTVILLHGLALAAWALYRAEYALRRWGYRTVNLSYPSRLMPFEELVSHWLPQQLATRRIDPAGAEPLHVVTQSMGGLLLRGWLQSQTEVSAVRRAVMIAPPNHGTTLVDQLRDTWWFEPVFGINAPQLGTDPAAIVRSLGPWPPTVELGVIAGDRPVVRSLNRWCDEPSDGKVPVASTRLDGMKDHIVLPYSHTWLQYRRAAIEQMLAFIKHGTFSR